MLLDDFSSLGMSNVKVTNWSFDVHLFRMKYFECPPPLLHVICLLLRIVHLVGNYESHKYLQTVHHVVLERPPITLFINHHPTTCFWLRRLLISKASLGYCMRSCCGFQKSSFSTVFWSSFHFLLCDAGYFFFAQSHTVDIPRWSVMRISSRSRIIFMSFFWSHCSSESLQWQRYSFLRLTNTRRTQHANTSFDIDLRSRGSIMITIFSHLFACQLHPCKSETLPEMCCKATKVQADVHRDLPLLLLFRYNPFIRMIFFGPPCLHRICRCNSPSLSIQVLPGFFSQERASARFRMSVFAWTHAGQPLVVRLPRRAKSSSTLICLRSSFILVGSWFPKPSDCFGLNLLHLFRHCSSCRLYFVLRCSFQEMFLMSANPTSTEIFPSNRRFSESCYNLHCLFFGCHCFEE